MNTVIKQTNKQKNSPFSDIVDLTGLVSSLAKSLYASVVKQFPEVPLSAKDIIWEHPKNSDNGDYSTNVAMRWQRLLAVTTKKHVGEIIQAQNIDSFFANPQELALALKQEWEKNLPKEIEKVEAISGFLNIWLNNEYLVSQVEEVLTGKEEFGESDQLKDKKILLEHTSPNPQTTIMLGHLRNNFLGMTSANLLTNAGAKVMLDCIVNDRGVHLCRSMWGYLMFASKKNGLHKEELLAFKDISQDRLTAIVQYKGSDPVKGRTLVEWCEALNQWFSNPRDYYTPNDLNLKSDHANLIWYVLGSRAYKEIEGVEQQVHEILLEWEANDPKVRKLWKKIIGWSEEGYAETYKRIGSHHDKYWYESDHWQEGKDIVEDGLKRGIFKYGDPENGKQPIVTDLANDGLPDTVVIKSDGTGLYMTQDLALTRLKVKEFLSDLYVWGIGSEQTVYFQQMFAVIDKLGIVKKEQLFHLSHALINFKGGAKMSTRRGDVVAADETLDLLIERTLEIIKASNQKNRGSSTKGEVYDLAEKIAVGAVKYALLKYGRETTIQFDIDESLSLTGNSGPYLQYTYSRTQSVLNKFKLQNSNSHIKIMSNFQCKQIKFKIENSKLELNSEELTLIRTIYLFPEVILQATKEFAPNLICNYLFDLAQKFNLFYDKHRILNQNSKVKNQNDISKVKMLDEKTSDFRLSLTMATGQVIKNGLTLLGITAPERM